MTYIHYNQSTGAIIRAYHSSCIDIPEPNVTVDDAVWQEAVFKGREKYVDITKDPPELYIGDPIPYPEPAKRYSKLKIVRKAKLTSGTASNGEEQSLWTALKAFIQAAGVEDEWLAAAWLASDDDMFTGLCEALAQQFPGFDIAGFLADCNY